MLVSHKLYITLDYISHFSYSSLHRLCRHKLKEYRTVLVIGTHVSKVHLQFSSNVRAGPSASLQPLGHFGTLNAQLDTRNNGIRNRQRGNKYSSNTSHDSDTGSIRIINLK